MAVTTQWGFDDGDGPLDRLVALGMRLSGAVTVGEAAEAVADAASESLDPDRVGVLLLTAGGQLQMVSVRGIPAQVQATFGTMDLDAPLPATLALRHDEVIVCESLAERDSLYPALVGSGATAAFIVVPLRPQEGPAIGVLSIGWEADRSIDHRTRRFVQGLADLCAQAVARTQLAARVRRAATRQRFLAAAGEILMAPGQIDEVVARVARLSVQELADTCAISVLDEDDALRTVAIAHADPDRQVVVDRLRERQPVVDDPALLEVLRTGEPLWAPAVDQEMRVTGALDDEHRALLDALGTTSALILPLRTRVRPVGLLFLLMTDPSHELDAEDRAHALDLAQRAALAIDHARLADALAQRARNLEVALASRITVEQAKGFLAARWGVTPDDAFVPLRRHARTTRRRIDDVAKDVLSGALAPEGLTP